MSIAIVGSGLAGFTAYQTLRRGGLEPPEIAVFGTEQDPAAPWRRRADAIRQREMRSESDGHCLASSFPGLAVRAAVRHRSAAPLVSSVLDRHHPTVAEFLRHVEELRERSGWNGSVRAARVEHVRAVAGGFELDGHGVFRHVLLAPGHPGLNLPEDLRGDPRVVHSYEPHEYDTSVVVVGAGLEAAVNGARQVICATGFRRGFRHDALLAALVDEHGLATEGDWIVLDPDATVPALTDAGRTLALAGVPAQWAFPAADTLAGARYVAHAFLRRIRV